MKWDKTTLGINAGFFLLIGIYGLASAGLAGLGLGVLLIALINIPVAIIFAIAGKKSAANTAMVFLAIWLLVGFSICSSTGMGSFH